MGLLTTRLHQVIDPIVLEVVRGRVKTIRLRDKLHFLVIVRSPSICSNDSSFEVGMLKVDSRIVNIGFLLLNSSLLGSFSFASLHRGIEHRCSIISDCLSSLRGSSSSLQTSVSAGVRKVLLGLPLSLLGFAFLDLGYLHDWNCCLR